MPGTAVLRACTQHSTVGMNHYCPRTSSVHLDGWELNPWPWGMKPQAVPLHQREYRIYYISMTFFYLYRISYTMKANCQSRIVNKSWLKFIAHMFIGSILIWNPAILVKKSDMCMVVNIHISVSYLYHQQNLYRTCIMPLPLLACSWSRWPSPTINK